MSASARVATPSQPDAGRAPWRRALGAARLAVLLIPAVMATAAAQPLDAHAEAGRAFDTLRALQPDRMPRLADGPGGAVLQVLGDAPRFLDAAAWGPADLGALSELCDRDKAVITSYFSFEALQQGEFVAATVVRNIHAYQDELAVLQPFLARCIARQVPVAEAMLRQMGERQASQLRLGGLKRSQMSLLQLYAGLSNCFTDAGFGPAYCGLLEVMAELAPVHARALPPASRAAAVRMLPAPASLAAGPQRVAVERIVNAMRDESCVALCLLGTGP